MQKTLIRKAVAGPSRVLTRGALCWAALSLLFATAVLADAADSNDAGGADVAALSLAVFAAHGLEKQEALDALLATGDRSLIPTLVLAMRWTGDDARVASALSTLTGAEIRTWRDAYEWQEAHPKIAPHPSYRALKLRFLGNTDPRFRAFFDGRPEGAMRIRLEEIVWGGVTVDGIPSLDAPKMTPGHAADYLQPNDLVFGVQINGDARAYPLRIMGWHEMMNDVVGGVPIALAYCTLCGSGMLFETEIDDQSKPLTFGNSGLLYRSNKLMYDRETQSLWNQFSGEAVIGPMSAKPVKLRRRPMIVTTWREWRLLYPDTRVLSPHTGYARDYGSGVAYRDYFASPDLMFPAIVGDESVVRRKDYVFGVETIGAARAWPLEAFRHRRVINDAIGETPLVLIGDAESRTVRAFERGDLTFDVGSGLARSSDGRLWRIEQNALTSEDGESLRRVPGRVAYWFAWNNFLGVDATLYALGESGQ